MYLNLQRTLLIAFAFAAATAAATLDRRLTIQPIQVCDARGLNCANSGRETYAAFDGRIFEQAGIDIVFLPFLQLWSPDLRSPATQQELDRLWAEARGESLAMFFVESLPSDFGVAAGISNASARSAIADIVFSTQRIDTIAHEIGHSLGLSHVGDPFNLMAPGGIRVQPLDIAEAGIAASLLTGDQILTARSSGLLTTIVPEPGSGFFPAAALLAIAVVRFWRRA